MVEWWAASPVASGGPMHPPSLKSQLLSEGGKAVPEFRDQRIDEGKLRGFNRNERRKQIAPSVNVYDPNTNLLSLSAPLHKFTRVFSGDPSLYPLQKANGAAG